MSACSCAGSGLESSVHVLCAVKPSGDPGNGGARGYAGESLCQRVGSKPPMPVQSPEEEVRWLP